MCRGNPTHSVVPHAPHACAHSAAQSNNARIQSHARRGFATLLVFGVIVFAAFALATMQAASTGQAMSGRESLARVRAAWAARAGLEATLARLEAETDTGDTTNAFAALEAMAQAADGSVNGATWSISSQQDGGEVKGPEDCASKLNIARMSRDDLLALKPYMTEDVADSMLDWIDGDDDSNPLGAELGYYRGLQYWYEPRNGVPRSVAELELVAGVSPRDLRGEDWNLNGVLDPNEDDGDESFPPDNADGVLERGWSGLVTASSVESPKALSGQTKIDLTSAGDAVIAQRVGVTNDQAGAIARHIDENETARLGDFLTAPLGTIAQRDGRRRGAQRDELRRLGRLPALTRDQLAKLFDETSLEPPSLLRFIPSRLNINTCEARVLESLPQIPEELGAAIVSDRAGKAQGYESIVELLDVPGMTGTQLSLLSELLTTRSNVYAVTVRGRDDSTGIEHEIVAVLDASALPATLREVRTR